MSEVPPPRKADPNTKKILVIEDDENVRSMIKSTLEIEGFQVKTARDGRGILNIAVSFEPDLVISDVMMPGGGGYEVLRSLQSDDITRRVPVIIISGYSFDSSTKEMLLQEPNVKEFVEKPIRPPLLMVQIHKILNTLTQEEKIMERHKKDPPDLKKFDDIF